MVLMPWGRLPLPPFREEFPCACGVAGHEGLAVFVEYEDPLIRLRALAWSAVWAPLDIVVRACGSVTASGLCPPRNVGCREAVTFDPAGAAGSNLPSPMFSGGARWCGRESVGRFVPAPRGVCSHGFQSGLLRKHSPVGLFTCGKRSHRRHFLLICRS